MVKGKYIVLEGMVGSGKSTQVDLLKTFLEKRNINFVYGREPGGVPVAERIRDVVLDPQNKDMAPLTAMYLFSAARAEYISRFVKPAIDSGKTVITDRSFLSTIAFQGHGHGLDLEVIIKNAGYAVQGYNFDLGIILDVNNIEAAMTRARKATETVGKPDRFETEDIAFHIRVRDGYRSIPTFYPAVKLISSFEEIGNIEERIAKISNEIS